MSAEDQPGRDQDPGRHDEVGSLAEEAFRLFGALNDAARDHEPGADGCTWCPLCRAVHTLRRTSPEVGAHLAAAASSLLQAAAAALATAVPDQHAAGPGAGPGRRPGMERVELDDEPTEEDL